MCECGAGGNCQFHVVAEAIRPWQPTVTAGSLRTLVGLYATTRLTHEDFSLLLEAYRLEAASVEFQGAWDPLACRTPADWAAAVTRPNVSGNGYDFQGDHFTLAFLGKALGINIVLFDPHRKTWQNHFNPTPETPLVIFVLYHSRGSFQHYQLLGASHGNVKVSETHPCTIETIFDHRRLPPSLAFACIQSPSSHTSSSNTRPPENASSSSAAPPTLPAATPPLLPPPPTVPSPVCKNRHCSRHARPMSRWVHF